MSDNGAAQKIAKKPCTVSVPGRITIRRGFTTSVSCLLADHFNGLVNEQSSVEWKEAYAVILMDAGRSVPHWLAPHKPRCDVTRVIGWFGSKAEYEQLDSILVENGVSMHALLTPLYAYVGKMHAVPEAAAVAPRGAWSPEGKRPATPPSAGVAKRAKPAPSSAGAGRPVATARLTSYAASLGLRQPLTPEQVEVLQAVLEDKDDTKFAGR